jgi:hypothetical protein
MPRASLYLSSFTTAAELANVIATRLAGIQMPGLPPFERFEGPADIFVDVALYAEDQRRVLSPLIREASAVVLQRYSKREAFDQSELEIIAEAIFLAARIEAAFAIPAISTIAMHHDAGKQLPNGEPLRSRALRALFGLLIAYPNSRSNDVREVFERFKFEAAYLEICLPALAALYGSNLQELAAEARAKGLKFDNDGLNLQLHAAGVRPPQ